VFPVVGLRGTRGTPVKGVFSLCAPQDIAVVATCPFWDIFLRNRALQQMTGERWLKTLTPAEMALFVKELAIAWVAQRNASSGIGGGLVSALTRVPLLTTAVSTAIGAIPVVGTALSFAVRYAMQQAIAQQQASVARGLQAVLSNQTRAYNSFVTRTPSSGNH
jgi:hypothetical protein